MRKKALANGPVTVQPSLPKERPVEKKKRFKFGRSALIKIVAVIFIVVIASIGYLGSMQQAWSSERRSVSLNQPLRFNCESGTINDADVSVPGSSHRQFNWLLSKGQVVRVSIQWITGQIFSVAFVGTNTYVNRTNRDVNFEASMPSTGIWTFDMTNTGTENGVLHVSAFASSPTLDQVGCLTHSSPAST